MAKPTVSEHFLLQGAVFALEQCQRLLQSAVALYNNGDYATSVALAMYSHEELGLYWSLRNLREAIVTQGEQISIDEVKRLCFDHEWKQTAGQGETILRAPRDSKLGQAIGSYIRLAMGAPDDPEFLAAGAFINDAHRSKRKRQPDDRHRIRMRALYVEPNTVGDGWNRPSDQDKQSVLDAVCEAANAYSFCKARLSGLGDDSDNEFVNAMHAWAECPDLPAPVWPAADSQPRLTAYSPLRSGNVGVDTHKTST